jgi:hypothetical protein
MAQTIYIPMTEEEFWQRAEKVWEEAQRIARLRQQRPWTFDTIRVLWGTASPRLCPALRGLSTVDGTREQSGVRPMYHDNPGLS